MIQAVIFNLDGVLVGTDDCHYQAWKRLAHEQGIPLTVDTYRAMAGMKRMDSLKLLLKKAERSYAPAEMLALSARKNDLFNDMIDELNAGSILPGALDTVRQLREMGIKTAVGSSSENAGGILRQLKIDGLFDVVVDGEQLEKGKPDPEVYLLAARKLCMPTSDCLVIENAPAGLEAARQAGMKAIAVGAAAAANTRDFHPAGLWDFDLPALVKRDAVEQYVI